MKTVPEPMSDVERAAVERALRIFAEEIDESSVETPFVERIADLRGHDLDAHALAEHACEAFTVSVALAVISRALRAIVGTCAADERARALAALAIADGMLDGTVPPDTREVGNALSKLDGTVPPDTRTGGPVTKRVAGACSAALAIANAVLAARGWSGSWATVAHVTRVARACVYELGESTDLLAGVFVASLRVEIEREHAARERTATAMAVVPIARGGARRKARAS